MSLFKQETKSKKWMDKKVLELNFGNSNSKKYKLEII